MFGVEKLFTINQQPNQHGKLFKLKVKILNVFFLYISHLPETKYVVSN